ncbi:PLP-dependent aminotransferase family protein [Streptomyces sp. NBC_00555]|uniref:aminotransferase-like domain-containing protein n=1 Tax=Streptomyces sp. NBC_00555 TaxID=2903662 RepID=UPI0022557E8F|nr:PLP-dependent aminotransferase family protein [Streptomyces sp. NBC_00555]MCX5016017.1 PLP-dependent aminotransferase family protein [Streptomyces sp. NBC_00555]
MRRRVPPPGLAGRTDAAGSSVIREALALTARPEVISFAGGLPASELIDTEGIRAAYDQVLSEAPHRVLQYSVTDGDPELREAVAARLVRGGLAARPDGLLITTGAQQALTLLATVLLEPGDTVLVEEPTYLAALQCFGYAGARVVAVPTDRHGIDVEALADAVERERPKLLYLVPDFQNPTGHTLPLDRRREVARLASARGFWIAEDDPYGELRFRGSRLPWISALEGAADRTVLLGSLSKVVAPGMRLGWLHGPPGLRRAAVLAKQALDLHSSTVDQAAAARYLRNRDLDARLDRVRALYRERCDTLLEALPRVLPPGSTWSRPDGGMFVWVRLPDGWDAAALLPQAVAQDVAYVPGAPFFAGRPDPATLRMSFATHGPADIGEGMRRLARTFARATPAERTRVPAPAGQTGL